jgi:phage terminase large subunit GpA-like protein
MGVGDRHEFWCLDRGAILGDLGKDFLAMYQEVDTRIFGRLWETRDGKLMRMAVAAQDAMGHHSGAVYQAVKRRPRRLLAYRGQASTGSRPLYKLDRHDEHGVRMLHAATDTGKDLLFTRLRNTVPGPGYIHFPLPDQWHKGFDDSFFEELTSEKKEIEWRDGRRIAKWKKKKGHAHNEALDLAVMVLILFEAIQQPLEKRAPDYLPPGISKPAADAASAVTPAPATNGNGNGRPTRRMRQNVWGSGGIAGGLY